jgi:hypothetical protein
MKDAVAELVAVVGGGEQNDGLASATHRRLRK